MKIDLSKDEKQWLKRCLAIAEKQWVFNPLEVYSLNHEEFSKDFFPEEFSKDLVDEYGITLLGTWLIDQKHEFLKIAEELIIELKKIYESDLNTAKRFGPLDLQLIQEYDKTKLSKVIRMVSKTLPFFLNIKSWNSEGITQFVLPKSYHSIRKYKNFISLENEMLILEKHGLSNPKKGSLIRKKNSKISESTFLSETEENTAFIIMQINSENPELEDILNCIKEVCKSFGIDALRADEIEHQDTITKVILERIRKSEFIIADLSGERPNVYYEIGFAHALKKRPILIRKKGQNLHFDLSVHNVPEYKNISDLKKILTGRFEAIMGHKVG